MTDASDIEQLLIQAQPIAARVSRSVASRFSEYVEWLDLQQECLLWACEHPDKLVEYLTPTEDDPKCKQGERKLHTTFRRRAAAVAQEAKAARLGYQVSDLQFYSTALVEELLPRAYDYDLWATTHDERGKISTGSDPAEGGNLAAMLMDMKRAYDAASDHDQRLLWARYISRPAVDWADLCKQLDRSRRTVERQVDRALRRMVNRLGGFRPDFDRRD